MAPDQRSTSTWLDGPSDLSEATVEDVPRPGESVVVRGLPAGYSNQAQSEALEMRTVGRDQIATVNTARLEVLQFAHGVVDPKFSVEEAEKVSEKYGPAFRKVVEKIDELSGLDKEAIADANARFQSGGESEGGSGVGDGAPSGSAGPSVPARTGA